MVGDIYVALDWRAERTTQYSILSISVTYVQRLMRYKTHWVLLAAIVHYVDWFVFVDMLYMIDR
jgi:hypothetical protein